MHSFYNAVILHIWRSSINHSLSTFWMYVYCSWIKLCGSVIGCHSHQWQQLLQNCESDEKYFRTNCHCGDYKICCIEMIPIKYPVLLDWRQKAVLNLTCIIYVYSVYNCRKWAVGMIFTYYTFTCLILNSLTVSKQEI